MFSHVICTWSATWSVPAESRDQSLLSCVITVCSSAWHTLVSVPPGELVQAEAPEFLGWLVWSEARALGFLTSSLSHPDAQKFRARVWEVVLWELLGGLQEIPGPLALYTNCVWWFCPDKLSHFSRVQSFLTPWTIARQTPLSMGILWARILEWGAMPSSRGSSWPRNWTHVSYVSCIGRHVLYH